MHQNRPRRPSIQSRPESALPKDRQGISPKSLNGEKLTYCSGNPKCTFYRRGPRSNRRVARQSLDSLLKASWRRASLILEDSEEEDHQQQLFLHGGLRYGDGHSFQAHCVNSSFCLALYSTSTVVKYDWINHICLLATIVERTCIKSRTV